MFHRIEYKYPVEGSDIKVVWFLLFSQMKESQLFHQLKLACAGRLFPLLIDADTETRYDRGFSAKEVEGLTGGLV